MKPPKHIVRAFCRAILLHLDGKKTCEWFEPDCGLCMNFDIFYRIYKFTCPMLEFDTDFPFNTTSPNSFRSDYWDETSETKYLNPKRLAWLKENAQ